MSTDPDFLTPDARRTANRLLEVLQRERIVSASDQRDVGPCEIHGTFALIEQAKGALMLYYGIDSHQAFAVLVGWSRISHAPLTTIAHTLLRGICEGNPQIDIRQRALLRWLASQLRERDPAHAQRRAAPAQGELAHESPRST